MTSRVRYLSGVLAAVGACTTEGSMHAVSGRRAQGAVRSVGMWLGAGRWRTDWVSDEARRLDTGEQRERFYAARQRGGLCAGCGKVLAPGEPVYLEWFDLRHTAHEVGSVGAECASPESLEDTERQIPTSCVGGGRRMYYEAADLAQAPTFCSRYSTFVASHSAKRWRRG
jgi:hypothetical protein